MYNNDKGKQQGTQAVRNDKCAETSGLQRSSAEVESSAALLQTATTASTHNINTEHFITDSTHNAKAEPDIASKAALWKNRTFLLVFSSNSLSLLGNTFHTIALNLWILQSSGSAKLMSSVLIIHLILNMLFSSVAGTIADRVDRRKLMWVTDMLRFIVVAIIAFLIFVDTSSYALIILLSGITALIGSFRSPAFQASLIEIVGKPQLTQAVGVISIADNIIRIAGYAIGGAAVAFFGGAIAIAIDAAAFLISAIIIMLAGVFPYKNNHRINKQPTSFKQDFSEGLSFIWRHPSARMALLTLPLIMLFFLSTFMLVQVMAVQVWQANAIAFGLIEACIPLGYVIGAAIIMKLDKRLKHKPFITAVSIASMGPLFLAIAFVKDAFAALPLILITGFLFSISTTIIYIMLRVDIEPQFQGRVFGLIGSATSVTPPIGLAVFASLSDWIGPAPIIICSGGLLLIVGAALSLHSFKRRS